MSTRLATAGHASGIAVFANGNGLAIVMDEQRTEDDDIAIAARDFLKKMIGQGALGHDTC